MATSSSSAKRQAASTGTRESAPVVLVLTSGVAVVGAHSFIVSPLLPDLAASLVTDVPALGGALAAYGTAVAGTALLASARLDRWPLRTVLVAATAALAAGLVMVASSTSVVAFGLAQAVTGAAAGLVLPATYALAAQVAPPDQVARVTGRVLLGWSLAMAAGVPLAAVVGAVAGWRAVFLTLAACAAAQAVLAAVVLPGARSTTHQPASQQPVPAARVGYLDALRQPTVLGLLVVVAGFMAAFYTTYAYLGDEVRTSQGRGVLGASVYVLAYGAGFGAGAFADSVLDRIGLRRVLVPSLLALTGVYVLLAAVTGSTPLLIVVCVAWGTANHVGLTALVALLGQAAPAQRGAVLALYSATTYAAGGVATALAGPLLAARGYSAVALAAATAVLAAAAVAHFARRRESHQRRS